MKFSKNDLLLYAVTDRRWLNGRTLYDAVKESLDGGVTFLQLREKNLDDKRFLEEARELKALCNLYNVPLIINDNINIAAEINADGVHVGQGDMHADKAREKLGPDKILGVSVQTVEQAIIAEKQGADYLGVGSIFSTGTKADAEKLSFNTLKNICNAVSIPVVAIGGITHENVPLLASSGICGIAVVSAIYAQDNIKSAAEKLKAAAADMVKA